MQIAVSEAFRGKGSFQYTNGVKGLTFLHTVVPVRILASAPLFSAPLLLSPLLANASRHTFILNLLSRNISRRKTIGREDNKGVTGTIGKLFCLQYATMAKGKILQEYEKAAEISVITFHFVLLFFKNDKEEGQNCVGNSWDTSEFGCAQGMFCVPNFRLVKYCNITL